MTRRTADGGRRTSDVGRGDTCVARGTHQPRIDEAKIEIHPEPSPAERTAILIALKQMIDVSHRDETPSRSAWAVTGRREALLGITGGWQCGWMRHRDRPAGW